MSLPYKLTATATADIERVLEWSEAEFGPAVCFRYAALIKAAIDDVSENPNRLGSRLRPEFRQGVRSWHLRLSRERARTPTGIVKQPRHSLLYYVREGVVFITGVLHDRQDVRRYFAK